VKPIPDEDLILHYYGEAPNAEEIERRLESSPELRRRFEALRLTLDALEEPPVPERTGAYGAAVWRRLEPRLEKKRFFDGFGWEQFRPRRQWALAAAMLVLLFVGFFTGRFWPREEVRIAEGLSADGRNRILLVTLAGHFERSEMLLLELANTHQNGEVDLSMERRIARELRDDSRLYRQTALQAGQTDLAAVLEQLERVLVELSHGSEELPSGDLGDIQMRLDESDILFKVRVVGTRLRQESRIDSGPRLTEPAGREI